MRRFVVLLALLAACNTNNNGGSGSAGGSSDGGSGGGGSAVDVRVTVSGSGRVTSTPAGIDCGSTCAATFNAGTVVGLSATPNAGWRFVGWSGSCSGAAGCQINSAGAVVTATFEALPPPPPGSHSLSVTRGGSGSGYISSSPGGIDCGGTCSATFADGAVVTLTATADNGSMFSGWGGACSGNGACTVTMSGDMTVSATFNGQGPPPPPPDDCAGLVPPAPGNPVQYVAANQDLVNGACLIGDGDGTGHVATLWQDGYQPHDSHFTFLDQNGANVGSYQGSGMQIFGQASGFMGTECSGAQCAADYVVLDPTGHLIVNNGGSTTSDNAAANDPTGGIVWQHYIGSTTTIVDVDPAGNYRWSRGLTAVPQGAPLVLGADRQGNVLVLWLAVGTWQNGTWYGQWYDHAGTPGPSFVATGASQVTALVPRVDNGFFVQSNNTQWTGQFEPLGQTMTPPPGWLKSNTQLHMVHGGTGYAVLPDAGQVMTSCAQQVDIYSKSGKLCGSSTFTMGSGSCTTNNIKVGYDGTVVQQLSRDLEAACGAAGHYCNCTYRMWPGYFH